MSLITINPDNPNYLDCNLDGVVLNPNGAIKYLNHYHTALYEDEKFDYFIPYQVKVIDKYSGIHRGPARRYQTLAMIIVKDTYTIIEERNGWGRLKEYPIGWILLNATEPMTGPGQNPEYDIPDAETATIPFQTSVHITKLTIDRLWCWIPAVESWVKAEDISYNQAGKLYNALHLTTIDLSQIDFSSLGDNPTLSDIGIEPEAWLLRFHDRCNYKYEGEYTLEAFQAIHDLNFVYPETVYNYNCIYYKDNKSDSNELGRASFSCSIGDWNPDWDKFIETSWQPDQKLYGYRPTLTHMEMVQGNDGITRPVYTDEHSWTFQIYTEPDINSSSTSYTLEEYAQVYGPKKTVGDRDWWPILTSDGNEWLGWTTEAPTYEYTTMPTDPDLYRDTILTLTWDYFGFDNNLYKPAGYFDGIYLWNPRTWNTNSDIHFSFQDLIQCGSQYVVYPCFDPTMYKLFIEPARVDFRTTSHLTQTGGHYWQRPEVKVYNGLRINLNPNDEETKISFYSPRKELGTIDVNTKTEKASMPDKGVINATAYTFNRDIGGNNGLLQPKEGYNYIVNVSSHRRAPTVVIGYGNDKTNEEIAYYMLKDVYDTEPTRIVNSTNLSKGYSQLNSNRTDYSLKDLQVLNIKYYIQSYKNFMMTHYWIPVPKGLWYRYNGEEKRITNNGLFDLLTGELKHYYSDYPANSKYTWYYNDWQGSTNFEDRFRGTKLENTNTEPASSGSRDYKNLEDCIHIYYANQDITSPEYYYFDNWNYTSSDVDYVIKTSNSLSTYDQPDLYAHKIKTLLEGLIVPVSKYTNDTANKVVGEWYYSSNQWFESKEGSIYAGEEFNKLKLSKNQTQICLINNADKTLNFSTYLNPADTTTTSISYGSTPMVLTVYYKYEGTNDNYYFDGTTWVPEAYTSLNTTEHNKNYAISRSTPYYSVPIADDKYRLGDYLYGERITVPYLATNNPDWGYTGLGWIQLNNNTSIVE